MGDTEENVEEIEETAEGEEAVEAGVPGKKLLGPSLIRTLIYVAVALVMIVISGTIAYIVAQRVGTPPQPGKISDEYRERENPLWYFDLESFSINTSDTDEPHFLKITLSLGYEQQRIDIQTELNQRRVQIRDIIISTLGSKRYDELNTQDKRDTLKDELIKRINDILINGKLKGIAFTEFILT